MSKRTPVALQILLLGSCLLWASRTPAQNLQLHYDLRHTLQPAANKANFPTFSFEYFKNTDSLNRGSFLLKLQADLTGQRYSAGQVYLQLTQTLRFWQPKVFLALNYSGGLGATPDGYGYYLSNALGTGLAYPFQWKGGWFSASLLYRYSAFAVPSHDPQVMFYFGRGFFHYHLFAAGSLVAWTENRNQGTDFTADLSGKKAAFFADPQLWVSVRKGCSVGTRVNVFYHLLTTDNTVQVYPTLGTKYQF